MFWMWPWSSPVSASRISGVDVYYQTAMARFDQQQRDIDALDSKLATTFTASSTVLPVAAALLAASNHLGWLALTLVGAATLVYARLLRSAYQAYHPHAAWSNRPDLGDLHQHLATLSNDEMCHLVGHECKLAIDRNADLIRDKASHITVTLQAFSVMALLLALAAIAALLGW